MEDGVEVAHENKWNLNLVLDGFQLLEQQLHTHTVLQGLGGGTLDDGAVGQGIAKGDTNLYHGDAPFLKREDNVGGTIKGGTARAEI